MWVGRLAASSAGCGRRLGGPGFRDRGELLHQPHEVHDLAALCQLAVAEVVDRPRLDRDAATGWGDTEERTAMSALPGRSSGDPISLGHHVLDPTAEVGECLEHLREELPQALAPRALAGRWVLLDEVLGDQVRQDVQVVLVEDLVREPQVHRLVVLDVGHLPLLRPVGRAASSRRQSRDKADVTGPPRHGRLRCLSSRNRGPAGQLVTRWTYAYGAAGFPTHITPCCRTRLSVSTANKGDRSS